MLKCLWVGRGRVLFPTFLLLVFSCNLLWAGDWGEALYNLLGFPRTQALTLSRISSTEQAQLSMVAGYDDIYRKRIEGQTALTLQQWQSRAEMSLPFQLGQTQHLLTATGALGWYYFDNLQDQTTLITQTRITNPHYAITWAGLFKDLYIGSGYGISQLTIHNTIHITAFPKSADKLTNLYFFDLLEPTFGRELTDSVKLRQNDFTVWGAARLTAHHWLGFTLEYSNYHTAWGLRYINSGNKAALRGPRRIDLPVDGAQKLVQVALLSEGKAWEEVAVALFHNQADLYIDNNPPASIDFDSLGDMRSERLGALVSSRLRIKNWVWQVGLAAGRYDWDVFLRTPVLGLQWGFFPIAHSATLRLSKGQSYSEQLGVARQFKWRNWALQAGLQYTHCLYDFWVKGRADLEFGLTSRPLNYPYKYDLHLLEANFRAEWRVGVLGIGYQGHQLLPYGRRLDDSPIHLTVPKEGLRYSQRGGSRHQIELRCYF